MERTRGGFCLSSTASQGVETNVQASDEEDVENDWVKSEHQQLIADAGDRSCLVSLLKRVKLVLKKNRYFVKSPYPEVLRTLLKNVVIAQSRIHSSEVSDINGGNMFTVSKVPSEMGGSHTELIGTKDITAVIEEKETHSFEIDPAQVENVKQRFLPNALNYPMLEEHDFRNDMAYWETRSRV